jgi:hypothetical protein
MGNSINNIKFLGRKFFGVRNLNTSPVYDVDAQNYFNANTSITSAADKNAINTFYLGLKSDGIYTKIKAMYLPIWGSAATCKWNLINPLDTNAAFRLAFSNGWTYSSNGITPTSAYTDTYLITNTAFATDHNKHLSFYNQINVNSTGNSSSIGSDTVVGGWCRMSVKTIGNAAIVFGGTGGTTTIANTDSRGFYIANRPNSTSSQIYKNGSLFGNGSSANGSTSQINQTLLIGAARSGISITYYDNKQCSFASIGDSLNATEQLNFSSRVNTLMTYFGINVY